MKFSPVASLALWEARVIARKALHVKAQRDLTRARNNDDHPRQALKDRRDLRSEQLAEARRMVELRKQQIRGATVSPPVSPILQDSWGYHPPTHDGIDLICQPNAPLRAICKSTVVRADASGWWGKGAQASSGHPVSDGDGIIVLRSLVDSGPIRKGMNLCYGHAEHATVKAGDVVQPGQVIGKAGFANAWHSHFMVNERSDTKGLGDQDPRPIVNYSRGK